jgi:hypothetical protein
MTRAELISLNAIVGIDSVDGSLRVMGFIFSDVLLLGHIGGVMGFFIAFGLITRLNLIPMIGEAA